MADTTYVEATNRVRNQTFTNVAYHVLKSRTRDQELNLKNKTLCDRLNKRPRSIPTYTLTRREPSFPTEFVRGPRSHIPLRVSGLARRQFPNVARAMSARTTTYLRLFSCRGCLSFGCGRGGRLAVSHDFQEAKG